LILFKGPGDVFFLSQHQGTCILIKGHCTFLGYQRSKKVPWPLNKIPLPWPFDNQKKSPGLSIKYNSNGHPRARGLVFYSKARVLFWVYQRARGLVFYSKARGLFFKGFLLLSKGQKSPLAFE
jgi:hypothetical protein